MIILTGPTLITCSEASSLDLGYGSIDASKLWPTCALHWLRVPQPVAEFPRTELQAGRIIGPILGPGGQVGVIPKANQPVKSMEDHSGPIQPPSLLTV